MKRIRLRVVILACWLIIFYNIEQLIEPIQISRLTYTFVLAMVVITLIAPRITRIPLWMAILVPIPFLLVLNALIAEPVGGPSLPLLITELCAIALTIALSHWVGMAIGEFEDAVAHITIGHHDRMPEPASTGNGSIYREVRRARNHQRPLALLAVGIEEKSIQSRLDKMVQEAQLTMMKQYALSQVSKTLCDGLEDCDLVVQSNEHFLVVLPETKSDDLPGLIDRLRQQVTGDVGVELIIGSASVPEDGYTLEGLIDKATGDMREDLESEPFLKLARLSVKHDIS